VPEPAPAEPAGGKRRVLFGAALAGGVALLVLPVAFSDGRKLLEVLSSVRIEGLTAAVILTVLSYLAMSRSYQGIACAAGEDLPFRQWVRITLVSNTANYLVTTAGLSGFAVRMYLLSQKGVRAGQAVLISLVQTFLTNLTLLAFILLGFATLVARHYLPEGTLVGVSAVLVMLTAILAWAAVLVVRRDLRRRTLFRTADGLHRILRRVSPRWTPGRLKLWRFQHNLNEGFDFLLARKDRIVAPTAWITFDWVLTGAGRARDHGVVDDGRLREPRRAARAGGGGRPDLSPRVLRAAALREPVRLPRAHGAGGEGGGRRRVVGCAGV
jgi:uncharacterized membrane protein YbhN (UPF0104 family)